MAAKKKNLVEHQSNIRKLLDEIEKEKKLLQEYENNRKYDIGKLYYDLLLLENKEINVDMVVDDLKEQIKNKKAELKNKKNSLNTSHDTE